MSRHSATTSLKAMNSTTRPLFLRFAPQVLTTIIVWCIFAYCFHKVVPSWTGVYRVGDKGQDRRFHDSLTFNSGETLFTATGTVSLSYIHPTTFRIVPDDCLLELSINDRTVLTGLPLCDYKKGGIFRLGEYLHPGQNTFKALVRNNGGPGGLTFEAVMLDRALVALFSLVSLPALFLVLRIMLTIGIEREPTIFIWFFGTVVRFLYFLGTPPSMRAYDAQGHHDYIIEVLHHFSIPPPNAGWEFYQPPLYYFLVATALLPFKLMECGNALLLQAAQVVSFIISSAALAAGIWVGKIVFRDPRDSFFRLGFAISLAVLPGLVMFASRITNDSLMPLLGFLFLGLLLHWHETGRPRAWYASIVILGLALLTKNSAVAYIPIAIISLVYKDGGQWMWRRSTHRLLGGGLILALMVGWYWIYRISEHGKAELVRAQGSLNPALAIKVTPLTFLPVNPISVLRHPYNNTWIDGLGRDRMWSFLPKSAFTGEWNFGERIHGAMRIIHGMIYFLFFPLGVIALIKDLFRRRFPPLWLSLAIVLGAMIAVVIRHPFGVMLDFRFVPIVTLPVMYYVLNGAKGLPVRLSLLLRGCLIAFWLLCLFVLYEIVSSA